MIFRLTTDWLDELCRIEHEAFSDPWSIEMLREELCNPLSIYIGIREGDKLLGYAGMQIILDEGHIHNVAVSHDFRRQGIARRLTDRLLEIAEEHVLSVMFLEVRESNTAAIALYESLGFDTVGHRQSYYRNPQENALLMTKIL